MLNGLSTREKARIQRRRIFEILHHFFALVDQPEDSGAGFALGSLRHHFENLLQTLNLTLGLAGMLFKALRG